jgi:hypothetical protein
MEKKGHKIEIEQSSKFNIKEIRMKAKFFDLRLNQVLQSASNVDLLQHIDFANQMKYPELASWNVHDNLGVCFDSDKNIIGNTQYTAWVYQDESIIKKPLTNMDGFEIQNAEAYAFGVDLGSIIGSLSDGFSGVKDFIVSDVLPTTKKLYANDFNTNRFLSDAAEKYKPIRLLLLHMLSSMGFILGIVKDCIIRDSGLLLRLEYIIYHSVLERFKQLQQYTQKSASEINDENLLLFLSKVDTNDNFLRSAEFGTCMRHYGLTSKDGEALIDAEKFNLALPLCGLVESHFNTGYYEYRTALESKLFEIHNALFEYMKFDDLLSINDDMLVKD